MPNCAGGMTIVQLGADLCNEGRADECRQKGQSADNLQYKLLVGCTSGEI